MPASEVDWRPAVLVLLVGLAFGATALLRMRRRGVAPGTARPVDLRDLDAQLDALLGQLRELEDTAGKRTQEQLARERYALELSAARVLMARTAIDEHQAPAASHKKRKKRDQDRTALAPPGAPPGRRLFFSAGSALVLGLLVLFVVRMMKPRLPAGGLTGETPQVATRPSEQAGPEAAARREAQLRQALQLTPEDLDARVELVRHLLARNELPEAWKQTQLVLARVPNHPRALAQQAMIQLATGHADAAEAQLKRVLATTPDVRDAWLYLIVLYLRTGRLHEAEETIAAAATRFPKDDPMLPVLLAELRRRSEAPAAPAR